MNNNLKALVFKKLYDQFYMKDIDFSKEADLLTLVCDVNCDFVTFLFGILGQVRFLIVSIPDPCCLSYYSKEI